MTNIHLPIEAYRDLESLNLYEARKAAGYPEAEIMASLYARSRDNARTPMQWDASPHGGFTTGTPWLTENPNYREINATAALADPDSIFHYYRRLIALRKTYPVFVHGDFTLLEPDHPCLFVYRRRLARQSLLVICNYGGGETAWSLPAGWDDAQCLISNYPDRLPGRLRPWEARILLRTEKE